MTKRHISLLLVITLLLGIVVVTTATALIGPQYVYTANGKGLYMRSAPSRDASVVTSIPYGAMVDSYEYYDNNWGYVSYNGYSGYCMSRYFVSSPPGPAPSPTHHGGGGGGGGDTTSNLYSGFAQADYYVSVRPSTPTGYVNMRYAPSKNQPIRTTYYSGQQLRVIAENSTWAQVYDEANQVCGYMMRSFLTTLSVGSGADS